MNDKWLERERGEKIKNGWVQSHPKATFLLLCTIVLSILIISTWEE